jgi:AGZA family xanthine/uracil permease-like MFS transporter
MPLMLDAIRRYFEFEARGSNFARELRGALATFLTMSYILFVNPNILQAAGVPFASAVACTAAAAGLCSILMGLYANFPLALASGMGLNALVVTVVAQSKGTISWQTAMGIIALDGVVMMLLVLGGLREAMMNAIPRDLRRAIAAGIGLFIAFIGAVNARIVIVPASTVEVLAAIPEATLPPVTHGSLSEPSVAVALVGLMATALLMVLRVKGALVLGILFSTAVALPAGLARLPDRFDWPRFDNALQADVQTVVLTPALWPLVLTFVLVNFFDALGTVTAVSEQAGLRDDQGQVPGLRDVLLVESASASIGGLFGVSSVTVYVESAAGVAEGARTGLHSVGVGLLFLLAILAAPVAGIVPPAATAPAMILVGFLMATELAHIDFTDLATAIPAFVTAITVPFTYSIAHGVGYGFLTFVGIHVLAGRFREVHPLMYAAAAVFAAYFVAGLPASH